MVPLVSESKVQFLHLVFALRRDQTMTTAVDDGALMQYRPYQSISGTSQRSYAVVNPYRPWESVSLQMSFQKYHFSL